MTVTVEDLVAKVRHQRPLPSAARCRRIRLRAGLTQAEVAAALNVKAASVARWEKTGEGGRKPRGETRSRYIDLLEQLDAAMRRDAA